MSLERTIDVETACLKAIERLMRGETFEDGVFEFKRELTDTAEISRQLAAHANAAKRHHIVWIIGYDEKDKSYHGPCTLDLAKWWPTVEKRFDGPAPEPLSVPFLSEEGKSVLALRFLTEQAPYVVKVSGSDRLEVPFRIASATRSATRSQLLRMLASPAQKPDVEIIDAGARLVQSTTADGSMEIWLRIFISPDEPLVYPTHKRSGFATGFSGMSSPAQLYNIQLVRPEPMAGADPYVLSLPDQTTISGPTLHHITAKGSYRHVEQTMPGPNIELELKGCKEEHDLRFNFGLLADFDQHAGFTGGWILADPITKQRLLPLK